MLINPVNDSSEFDLKQSKYDHFETSNGQLMAKLEPTRETNLSLRTHDRWIMQTPFHADPLFNLWEGRFQGKGCHEPDQAFVWCNGAGEALNDVYESNGRMLRAAKYKAHGVRAWNWSAQSVTRFALFELDVSLERHDNSDTVQLDKTLKFAGTGWMPNKFERFEAAFEHALMHLNGEQNFM